PRPGGKERHPGRGHHLGRGSHALRPARTRTRGALRRDRSYAGGLSRHPCRGDRTGGRAVSGSGAAAPAQAAGGALRVIVAVLDTNVLVSAFPAHGTVPALLIDAWRQGAFHLIVSEHILEELTETWRDPYWQARFSPTASAEVIALLRSDAI